MCAESLHGTPVAARTPRESGLTLTLRRRILFIYVFRQ